MINELGSRIFKPKKKSNKITNDVYLCFFIRVAAKNPNVYNFAYNFKMWGPKNIFSKAAGVKGG